VTALLDENTRSEISGHPRANASASAPTTPSEMKVIERSTLFASTPPARRCAIACEVVCSSGRKTRIATRNIAAHSTPISP
jgi:hypothetical protein